ncbi:hypothetical protein B0H14DRAFT_2564150 [Mycena olivaceomarginata]|nr:hypothetical protein B0H14DRAFT_2564150 [Mycena olivaceomarginata]
MHGEPAAAPRVLSYASARPASSGVRSWDPGPSCEPWRLCVRVFPHDARNDLPVREGRAAANRPRRSVLTVRRKHKSVRGALRGHGKGTSTNAFCAYAKGPVLEYDDATGDVCAGGPFASSPRASSSSRRFDCCILGSSTPTPVSFLPQDKVSAFAVMLPFELVHDTENATGNERLKKIQLIYPKKNTSRVHDWRKQQEDTVHTSKEAGSTPPRKHMYRIPPYEQEGSGKDRFLRQRPQRRMSFKTSLLLSGLLAKRSSMTAISSGSACTVFSAQGLDQARVVVAFSGENAWAIINKEIGDTRTLTVARAGTPMKVSREKRELDALNDALFKVPDVSGQLLWAEWVKDARAIEDET